MKITKTTSIQISKSPRSSGSRSSVARSSLSLSVLSQDYSGNGLRHSMLIGMPVKVFS